jgi:hypothetical protein
MSFDETAYITAKAQRLVDSGYSKDLAQGARDYPAAWRPMGISHEDHYNQFGKDEGLTYPTLGETSTDQAAVEEVGTTPYGVVLGGYAGSTTSEFAHDVAKQTGTAYEELGGFDRMPEYQDYDAGWASKAISDNVSIAPGSTYVDPGTYTVAGQLQQLLGEDSPYIAESRRQAVEQAGSRGLLNSSTAAGAGQRAAIESALPIAQQDAETYSKFGLQEQQARNTLGTVQAEAIVSGALNRHQAALTQQNQNIQNQYTALMRSADAQTALYLQDFQQQYETGMQVLQGEQDRVLQREQLSAEKSAQIASETSAVMQNYQISVENLMSDPDFLSMGSEAVNNAINELQNLASNTIGFIGASRGVDLSEFVDEYFAELNVMSADATSGGGG